MRKKILALLLLLSVFALTAQTPSGSFDPNRPIDASRITTGVLKHERGGLEADVSAYSGIPYINAGTTTELDTLAELNSALGTTISDLGPSVGPTDLEATDFGDFTCNGTFCVLDTVAAHTHDAADIVSGVFDDARVQESNVTQHEAALSLDATQLTSGVLDDARVQESNVTQHEAALTLDATQTTTGVFADAQISESSVTQHEAALSLDATQLTSGVLDDARVQESNVTQHEAALTLDATQTTTGVFADAQISESSVTQHEAALSLDAGQIDTGVLEHERGGLEADVSAYSGIPYINAGATSELDTLAELNTALGTTLFDFGSSIGPTELEVTDFGDFSCNGTSCVVENPGAHVHDAADITTGVLAHERGGLEVDASAADGLVRISGGATTFVNDLAGLNTALGTSLTEGSASNPLYFIEDPELVTFYDARYGTWQNLARTTPATVADPLKAWDDLSGNNFHLSRDSTDFVIFPGGDHGLFGTHINNNAVAPDKLILTSDDETEVDFATADPRDIYVQFSVSDSDPENVIVSKFDEGTGIGWMLYTSPTSPGFYQVFFNLQDPGGYIETELGSFPEDEREDLWISYDGSGLATGISYRSKRVEVDENYDNSGTLGETTNDAVLTLFGIEAGASAASLNIEKLAIFSDVKTIAEKEAFEQGQLQEYTEFSGYQITRGLIDFEYGALGEDLSTAVGLLHLNNTTNSFITDLSGLNSVLGSTLTDFGSTVGPTELQATDFGAFTCNGTTCPLDAHTHDAADITSGTLVHERGGLEADVSAYNGLVRISGGATSNVTNLAGLNTALGTTLTDFGSTVGPTELAPVDFGEFTCNGTTCSINDSVISSVDLAAEDYGDFTCTGSAGGCTVDTLDYTSDITEGAVTGLASFAAGAGDTTLTFDALGEKFTDMADAVTPTANHVLSADGTTWDNQLISQLTEAAVGIGNLSDVSTAGIANGDLMVYSTALNPDNWENRTAAFVAENYISVGDLSNVTITGIASGDTLVGSGSTLIDRPILNFDTDSDTGLSSTSSATRADISGLGVTLTGGTNGSELVVVTAQLSVSAATLATCEFWIVQDLDGVDTDSLVPAHYSVTAQVAGDVSGIIDTLHITTAFAPGAGTVVNYTVEWSGNGTNNCYQDDSYLLAVAYLDQ